jgi:hypothetical protein
VSRHRHRRLDRFLKLCRRIPALTASAGHGSHALLLTLLTHKLDHNLDLDFAMSRLAYYPTPATRRLGTFTLNARPSTSPRFATRSQFLRLLDDGQVVSEFGA